jgi:8-oxo-dGTP pyrophosphatase MutT (NUDIX family)
VNSIEDIPEQVHVSESTMRAEGAVWDMREDTFEFGADETLTRQFIDHTGAVMVIAVDEHDRALLIQQYRHPIGQREWELPGGLMDEAGESPLRAAQRELAEEASLKAHDWHLLLDTAPSPGGSTELIRIYIARDLSEAHTDFVRSGEEADMQHRWVGLSEIRDAIFAGKVQNGPLLHAVLALFAQQDRRLRDPNTEWERRQLVHGSRSGLEYR